MLVIAGKAMKYRANKGTRSMISTPMMPVTFLALIVVAMTL